MHFAQLESRILEKKTLNEKPGKRKKQPIVKLKKRRKLLHAEQKKPLNARLTKHSRPSGVNRGFANTAAGPSRDSLQRNAPPADRRKTIKKIAIEYKRKDKERGGMIHG